MLVAVLAGALAILVGGVLIWTEVREHRARRRMWRVVRVSFGRDVTTEAVVQTLTRIAGLRSGTVVRLDLVARAGRITHFVGTDQATVDHLASALRAAIPSAHLESVAGSSLPDGLRLGRAIRLGGRLKILAHDAPEATAAGVLAALQPLASNEAVVVRWTLRPGRAIRVPHQTANGATVPAEDRRMLRDKNLAAVLEARGLLATRAGHPKRGAHLLGRVSAVLRARSTSAGAVRMFPLSSNRLAVELDWLPWTGFRLDRYSAVELAGLIGWPIGAPALPGVETRTSPRRLPDTRLPRSGRILGVATWPGAERPVGQPVLGALSHSLIAGPTGVGKSTLLAHLAEQDMAAGRGLVLIDGKGDTVDAVLARVPEARRGDVIVLDCASDGPLPGLRLFAGTRDREMAADVVLSVFADLFRDSWGVLSERYLRAGLVAVAHDRGGTLADVPFVFTDAGYRRRLASKLTDPLTRATLESFEAMSAGERAQQLGSTLNKLSSLLGRPVVRTVLGQAHPTLEFQRVLSGRKIVLISLAPARVGAAASRLIGAVVVFALFQAVQRRSQLPEGARRPFMVSIDEPKALGDLPMPLDALLEQARGLGVGVTVAPQSLTQLPKGLREAILTNAATRVVFRQNADDARLLAKDLAGIAPEDLQDLAAYEAVARIGLGPGDVAAPVTIQTDPPTRPTSDPKVLREVSGSAHGQTLEAVDAALHERHTPKTSASRTPGRTARRPA